MTDEFPTTLQLTLEKTQYDVYLLVLLTKIRSAAWGREERDFVFFVTRV